jgi:hypothetical protein
MSCWCLLVFASGLIQSPALGVVATHSAAAISNGRHVIEFTIANGTDGVVTAWDVEIEATFSDQQTRKRSLQREGYLAHAGVLDTEGVVIGPKTSVTGQMSFGAADGRTIIGTRATLRCAVFADATAVGDPDCVSYVFSQRRREHDAIVDVLQALRAGRSVGAGKAALAESHRLLKAGSSEGEHALKKTMRENIERALADHPAIKLTPDAFADFWIQHLEARLRAIQKHVEPRRAR